MPEWFRERSAKPRTRVRFPSSPPHPERESGPQRPGSPILVATLEAGNAPLRRVDIRLRLWSVVANLPARPAMRLVAVLIATMLAGCSGSNSESPAGSSTGAASPSPPASSGLPSSPPAVVLPGAVLFVKVADGDAHAIYSLEGGSERQLTEPGAYQLVGPVSPDLRHVLVLPGGQIPLPLTGGTLDIDGTNFSLFERSDPTLNMVPLAWSPDGSRVAFLGWDDADPSRMGVYTARASDGGDLVRVTERPGDLEDVPLDYSPDGEWIVFYRAAHPDPDPHVDGALWTVRVDGTDATQISGNAHPADSARWSPDGQKILFATERLAPEGALWTVSPDGSDLVQLFVDPAGQFPIAPTWSPDGSQILFALDPTNDQFQHPPNTFAVINADGTGLRLVAGSTGFKVPADWWK